MSFDRLYGIDVSGLFSLSQNIDRMTKSISLLVFFLTVGFEDTVDHILCKVAKRSRHDEICLRGKECLLPYDLGVSSLSPSTSPLLQWPR